MSSWPLSAPSDPLFEIVADPARNLIRATIRGQWEVATVARFEAARVALADRMTAHGGDPARLLTLVDARDHFTQAQDVLAAWKASLVKPGMRSLRGAVLVASTLFKLQVRRSAMDQYQIFDSEDDGIAWLMTGRLPDGR